MKNWVDTLIDETSEKQALKIVLGQLRHRFGEADIGQPLVNQLEKLSISKLERLSKDLLAFESVADIKRWLKAD